MENRQLILESSVQLYQVIAIFLFMREHLIFGEVGLTGEVRGVSHVEQRLAEAIKMGFTRCIMPKTNAEVLGDNICQKIQVIGVSNVREVIQVL